MREIKVELYHKGKPYNIQSNIYDDLHVKDIINYHIMKYQCVRDEIIDQEGILKIELSDCEGNNFPCIHFESELLGINEELSRRIIDLDLFKLSGNLPKP